MTVETTLHVCFVCSGNICRSPYAEGLLRHLLAAEGLGERARVSSAGTLGIYDVPAHARMIEEAARRGFDLSAHRSQGLEEAQLESCDYILGLAHGHVEELCARYPALAQRTFLFGAFPRRDREGEIPDPIGEPEEDFVRCFAQIHAAMQPLLETIRGRLETLPGARAPEFK